MKLLVFIVRPIRDDSKEGRGNTQGRIYTKQHLFLHTTCGSHIQALLCFMARPEDARSVAFLRENSSGLLRASDGTRRLVRMHRAYHEYRKAAKEIPYDQRSACEAVPWPEKSDAVCWYCRRAFSCVPFKIPRCRNLDGSLTVYGNFCWLGCMVKYMWLRRTLTSPEQFAIVTQLARECGVEGRLPMAPDLEDLIESGGDMSWEEFDRLCHINTARVVMRFPPMVEAMVGIEETYDAMKSGGDGMDAIMRDVFGVPTDASVKTRALAYTFEQTLSSQEQMFYVRRNPKTEAHAIKKAKSMASDRGIRERRIMALMNEPSTIDLDKLEPPTEVEIARRLKASSAATVQHAGAQSHPSLFEQYVQEKRGRSNEPNDEVVASSGDTINKKRQQQTSRKRSRKAQTPKTTELVHKKGAISKSRSRRKTTRSTNENTTTEDDET